PMLPAYGVVIGQYLNYTTNQGRWMHVDLNINAGGTTYQAAVDVNEPNGLFQYQVFNKTRSRPFRTDPCAARRMEPASAQPDVRRHRLRAQSHLATASGMPCCLLRNPECDFQNQHSDLDECHRE